MLFAQSGTVTVSGGFSLIRAQFCRNFEHIYRIMQLYPQSWLTRNVADASLEKLCKTIHRFLRLNRRNAVKSILRKDENLYPLNNFGEAAIVELWKDLQKWLLERMTVFQSY
jgi:hypothetical protein